ncbi:hypothetical protein BOTBODRAFT_142345 [Botryobasidium botryosum FD-172 SS1]|uniref:Anaphase-promoting complex subunit 2 n=1 Tax=Botryobasidium botryosum (strain FD-172 SS1) TaxID=930990 RepID=A0A067MYX0_BOTB1|nr:hypothetical protein BOTBODRAFT_142345 [Botryobasidium botryosum FD-172 SS1]
MNKEPQLFPKMNHNEMSIEESLRTNWQFSIEVLNGGREDSAGIRLLEARAWEIACEALKPRNIHLPAPPPSYDERTLQQAFEMLKAPHKLRPLLQWFLDQIRNCRYMLQKDILEFTRHWEETMDVRHFRELFNVLSEWFSVWGKEVLAFKKYDLDGHFAFQRAFRASLLSILPPSFSSAFTALLKFTLVDSESFTPPASQSLSRSPLLFEQINTFGVSEDFENIITNVLYEEIRVRVMDTCPGEWEESMLPGLREWFTQKALPWIAGMYASGAPNEERLRAVLGPVTQKFDYHLCKMLCDLRTNEIFDIIVNYPNSMSAVLDLKECLSRTDQRAKFVQALRKFNTRRLLHHGAETSNILEQYINTIRCLRLLDPAGVLLFSVAEPIRRYLRERPDTIRCIVSNLATDDGILGLSDEKDSGITPIRDALESADDYSDPNWHPEPNDAEPGFRTSRPTDIISILVSIYDSRDLFIKELQILLGRRLLAITDGDYYDEMRRLEQLKLRFGDTQLQVCEVMMKDILNSVRTREGIRELGETPLHPTVISHLFWPEQAKTSLVLPLEMKVLQDDFATKYSDRNPGKYLKWIPNLGTVELKLELADRTVAAKVTPLQAAVIHHFSNQDTWTPQELADKLDIAEALSITSALQAWENLGVLEEMPDGSYFLLETAREGRGAKRYNKMVLIAPETVGEVEAAETAEREQTERMRVHWQFIKGMLNSFGKLTLEEIHGKLRFFAPDYDHTQEHLAIFMQSALKEGLVEVHDGVWRAVR